MPSFVRRSQVQEFDVKTDSNAMSSPTPPQNRPHKDTEDHRSGFAAISAKTPVDEAFRTAFLRNKLLIAHTHPGLDIRVREEAVAALVDRLGREAARDVITQPRPGGVGEGFFYNPDFKTSWGLGTSISGDFVCPAPPGGNVNTWLYLTATNRSGLGVEAFVSYDGQDTPHFRVFDWARTDSWQTDIPFTALENYLTTISAHGSSYPALPVWNSTWAIGANQYRNQALLYNHARGGWDLVYQYDYTATDAQQKTGWIGSWGPIIETFQPLYFQTNPMGALGAQLVGSDNNGVWGSWAPLSPPNSNVRTDNVGFNLVFIDPNYAFVVNS
jgi:hypothetical protein